MSRRRSSSREEKQARRQAKRQARLAKREAYLQAYLSADPLRKLELALNNEFLNYSHRVNFEGSFDEYLDRPLTEDDWIDGEYLTLWRDPSTMKMFVPRPIETYSLEQLERLLDAWKEMLDRDELVSITIRPEHHLAITAGLPVAKNSAEPYTLEERIKYLTANDAYRAARDAGYHDGDYFTLDPNADIIFALKLRSIKDVDIPRGSTLYPVIAPEKYDNDALAEYLDEDYIPFDKREDLSFDSIDWYKVYWYETIPDEDWELNYYDFFWFRDFPSQELILEVPRNWDKPDLIRNSDGATFAINVFAAYEKGRWDPGTGIPRKWDIDKIMRDFGGFKVDDKLYIGNKKLIEIGRGIRI